MTEDQASGLGCGALLLLIVGGIFLACYADNQNALARRQQARQLVPVVQERWPALFEKIDVDGDGLLMEEELRNAVMEGDFTGVDKDVVNWLYNHCHDVGHSIGSYRQGKYTVQVYAISKADLHILDQTAKRLWGG
jgi:hypothetical protein